MNVLETIVGVKRKEILQLKEQFKLSDFERLPLFASKRNSFHARLNSQQESGVIAEFKRKSPSRSAINPDASVCEIIPGYAAAGASAISVLTDQQFFGGSLDDLSDAKNLVPTSPLLRKDFILDEYQILEARAYGADIILLIAEILTAQEVKTLSSFAASLELEILLELHSEEQLDKLCETISYVGVNNRNLKNFEVDYERSVRLCEKLPSEMPKIAESGLSEASTLIYLYERGFNGFLIGEQFMKQKDPASACRELVSSFKKLKRTKSTC